MSIPTLKEITNTVVRMPSDSHAQSLANNLGLDITSVTWEDNARNKGSCWGPCISDMTLKVEGQDLPVIRSPNYEDITWDVELERIPLMVGNEHGETLFQTNLRDYLENFRDYLHDPSSWTGSERSLLREEDTCAIMSAQACFLPVSKEGGETSFNVSIYNYQTVQDDPAILSIVSSSNGTSAQIVDSCGSQKLYFNQNGEKCSFIGKRLSQHRVEQGRPNDGRPMTSEEKEQNVLLIIQVPLRQKNISRSYDFACDEAYYFEEDCFYDFDECDDCDNCLESMKSVDVEDAILSVGESEGKFREVGNLSIERDTRYPVRVTLQYYKATSNGHVDENVMAQVYQQIVDAREFGKNVGSLVVGGNTGRPTEFVNNGVYDIPMWWNEFWLMYGATFSQYTKEQAADKLFVNGRFCASTLNQCKSQLLSILGDGSSPNQNYPQPTPDFFEVMDD
eukprot:TRINITY_DN631_c0_g1_i1.p1 TRINITY_DN631_c0_g1~~TRINITY_DN631_c0_g1_i1.p1  ORF type:complete len:450 (-),score=101.39 TRINITY_DN631_c0_g1_i1:24-1373(-)